MSIVNWYCGEALLESRVVISRISTPTQKPGRKRDAVETVKTAVYSRADQCGDT